MMTKDAFHPALVGLVTVAEHYHEHTHPDAVHYGLPSPAATLILDLGAGVDVGWADDTEHGPYRVLAAGLHLRPALIRTHGEQVGIELGLTPMGARRLLGVPIADLASALVAAEDLPLPLGGDLIEQLMEASDGGSALALLQKELLGRGAERATAALRMPAPLAEAWRVLHDTGGTAPVAGIAAHVGWSRRQFTTRFTREFGVGPKEAARLFRFVAAIRRARSGVPLRDVAVSTGFADQAHLSREWRDLAGRPPGLTLREEFPILQATDPADAES